MLTDPVVRERVEVAWCGYPVPWTEITVAGGRGETDLRTVLRHPAGHGVPHPRSFGTFPRAVAESGADLAAIVHKRTRAPAEQAGLTDRDVVARDDAPIGWYWTWNASPTALPSPDRTVSRWCRSGTRRRDDGRHGEEHTGATPGTVVRRAER